MRDTTLFQLALGLTPPWHVASVGFDAAKKRLDSDLDEPHRKRTRAAPRVD